MFLWFLSAFSLLFAIIFVILKVYAEGRCWNQIYHPDGRPKVGFWEETKICVRFYWRKK